MSFFLEELCSGPWDVLMFSLVMLYFLFIFVGGGGGVLLGVGKKINPLIKMTQGKHLHPPQKNILPLSLLMKLQRAWRGGATSLKKMAK